jgi:hypothetical protein
MPPKFDQESAPYGIHEMARARLAASGKTAAHAADLAARSSGRLAAACAIAGSAWPVRASPELDLVASPPAWRANSA